jgi:hypothetical protein
VSEDERAAVRGVVGRVRGLTLADDPPPGCQYAETLAGVPGAPVVAAEHAVRRLVHECRVGTMRPGTVWIGGGGDTAVCRLRIEPGPTPPADDMTPPVGAGAGTTGVSTRAVTATFTVMTLRLAEQQLQFARGRGGSPELVAAYDRALAEIAGPASSAPAPDDTLTDEAKAADPNWRENDRLCRGYTSITDALEAVRRASP